MKNNLILFILLSLFLSSCIYQRQKIDRQNMLENHSHQDIIYLGETAFLNECESKLPIRDSDFYLRKWKNDLHIFTYGDLASVDTIAMENTITQINTLDLPIRLFWDKEKKGIFNVKVFFLKAEELSEIFDDLKENHNVKGRISTYTPHNSYCNSAIVGIVTDRCLPEYRASVVLHEFIHLLGLQGNSFSYSESILNDALVDHPDILRTELADIDKGSLRLLYSPAMPIGTTRKEFYNTFRDILPPRQTIEKKDYLHLADYIQKENISEEIVSLFIRYGHSDGKVLKWKNHPVIHFSDSVTPCQKGIIQSGVQEFNLLLGEKEEIVILSGKKRSYNVLVGPTLETKRNEAFDSKGIQVGGALIGDIPCEEDEISKEIMSKKVIMELLGGINNYNMQAPPHLLRQLTDREYTGFFLSPYVKSGMECEETLQSIKALYQTERALKNGYKELDKVIREKPLSDSAAICLVTLLSDTTFAKNIHKWREVKIGMWDNNTKYDPLIESICHSLPFADIQYVDYNECNFIIHLGNMELNKIGYNVLSINKDVLYGHAVIRDSSATVFPWIVSSILGFNIVTSTMIEDFDGVYIQYDPDWLEALEFYFSSSIQSGMEKEKIKQMILNYYPHIHL